MDRAVELFLRNYSNSNNASIDCTIHPSDEMYSVPASHPLVGPEKARESYFRLGSELTRTILQIATWRFPGKTDQIKVLEFACGHGRNVRHFVNCFPKQNLYVSDIYEDAVAFNIKQFQVHGRVSVHQPGDLHWDERFDLIVVPSLFSHLPESTFAGWIGALFNLLTDDGILVFSVHGTHLLDGQAREPASGILFEPWSESASLDPREYGMSYVTEPFVRDQIQQATGRDRASRTKRGFWRHQDFYIVPKTERTPLETFKYDRGVISNIEQIAIDDRGMLRLTGWAWDTQQTSSGHHAIVVSLDGQTLFSSKTFEPRRDVAACWEEKIGNCGFSLKIPIPRRDRRPDRLLSIEIVSNSHRECIHAVPLAAHLPKTSHDQPSPAPSASHSNHPQRTIRSTTVSLIRKTTAALHKHREIAALSLFWIVALLPVFTRLRHPTLLGDDVTRVVDLVRFPFLEHLLLRFGDHLAPLFQLVSSVTWESIRHDVRLAPLAFSAASVASWLLVLALLWRWLEQETRSRTASLVAVALVAQSPLVLETVYWYSASSFLWAIAGILLAVWGASLLAISPRRAVLMTALGCALGPAGTTIGVLAAPLAIARALLLPKASMSLRALGGCSAIAGFGAFFIFCKLAGSEVTYDATKPGALPSIDAIGGAWYTVTVPGRILWPSAFGFPASLAAGTIPNSICYLIAIIATAGSLALAIWPRARWNRRAILLGLALIYPAYFLTYASRTCMMKGGAWSERQFLYELAGRYHVLPLLGVALIFASILASIARIQRLEHRRAAPALIGLAAGLILAVLNAPEASRWNWMLEQPDQRATLAAVHRLGTLARAEGVDHSQLIRIFDPVFRPWNGSVLNDRPYAFHLMNLAIEAPDRVDDPIPDDVARTRLVAKLSIAERGLLGAGSCASMSPALVRPDDTVLAIAKRSDESHIKETSPGHFQWVEWPAYLEYEFSPAPGARVLLLPGLRSDHDIVISWTDKKGRWLPGLNVRWLQSPSSPKIGSAAIDLRRLIQYAGSPISRFRVELPEPGQLTLTDSPRLLR